MQDNRENLKGRLNTVFQEVFEDEAIEIYDDMTAQDIEEWDSLMHITLVIATEKEFGLMLNAVEVGGFENVGVMLDLLEEKATR